SSRILEDELGAVSVAGEISNFTHHSSGHMYFTLKDSKAAVDAVMFKGYNSRLNFKPRRGDEVTVNGTVSIFAPQGRYQLIVKTMTKSGLGRLEKEFLQLKEKLKKEGLFDRAHKKTLPHVPKKIGVVTSPTGAAIRDIINVISRRAGDVEIVLFPSRVQGKSAAGEISRAIKYFNENYSDMEVLIVGRGGGSLEDLWPFNEEDVARAIFSSQIPVISAVGHETDFSISDFVADLRAPTPSAAAELVIKDRRNLADRIEKAAEIMEKAIRQRLNSARVRYNAAARAAPMQFPDRILRQPLQCLDYLSENLISEEKRIVENFKNRLGNAAGQLGSLSPSATLKRGYSITYMEDSKEPIKNSESLNAGDNIKTVFYDGGVSSTVNNIERGEKDE
ncbi:MAG: exodeoxyribonuclease VII large subunit, partial [Elusimicrobiota bacterium]|nr:exodeoxyribonuclease VII large subunit [Elusimicrobiota bacterium]